jgi:hypothetical protein
MSLKTLLGAGTAAVAVLAAPAVATAAPVNLPAVSRTATADALTAANCAVPARSDRGVDRLSYVAVADGYLSVRTAGGAGSDWDLALLDGSARRTLATSQGFGSAEVAQAWVAKGQRVTVQACRLKGRTGTLQVRFELLKADLPKAGPAPQLIEVKYRSFADLELLEKAGIDVTHQHAGGVADVIVTGAEQLGALRATGLEYDVEIADLGEHYRASRRADERFSAAVEESGLPSGRTSYRQYTDFQTEMKQLVAEHPKLVKPLVMPKKSVLGREVQGLEISRDVNATDDGKPVFFLMGVHHAREWPSAEIAMEFAHLLTKGGDPRINQLLATARVIVVPIINPDGYIASRSSASAGDTTNNNNVRTVEAIMPPGGYLAYRRKNCGGLPVPNLPCELQYGIDPNRNYGEGWGGAGAGTDVNTQSYRGPGPWSEPETQGVHELSQRRQVTGLITLHTIGALVLRPPGRAEKGKAPDENETKRIGDEMGRLTGYPSQFSFQLYDTSGTTEDWNYAAAGTYGYTIEIGPAGGQFHMPYQVGVVDQWTGANVQLDDEDAPRGLREALLFSALETTRPKTHGVLEGKATAGRTVKVRRDFETKTAPACTYAQGYLNSTGIPSQASAVNCVAPGAVRGSESIKDFLESTTTVSDNGTFRMHVAPSTRPFVGFKYDDTKKVAVPTGKTEAWTLTCEDGKGTVLSTRQVVVDRGQRIDLGDLGC